MKKSNLRNFQAYRMYQAPEGGGEKPLRTSYLKDPLDVSTGRGEGVQVQRHTVKDKKCPVNICPLR